jgi:ubiquinone/menaquinone biosynthesis C-methylase UbiE
VLLLASAAAVLLVGLAATTLIFSRFVAAPPSIPPMFWLALLLGSAATLASLALRALRWVFLLRRAGARVPIRDAFIGYFAGLSLIFAPFLVGEIAVRAYVLRQRARVPIASVVAVNVWERILDIVAIGAIGAIAGYLAGAPNAVTATGAVLLVIASVTPVRRALLRVVDRAARMIGRSFEAEPGDLHFNLAGGRTWWTSLAASVVAWLLPAIGLAALVRAWGYAYGFWGAEYDYASSSGIAAFALAPGGVLVAGARLLTALDARGVTSGVAAVSIAGVRLATVGVATALGFVLLFVHWRSAAAESDTHFDDIASAYDVQIPESRRLALLERKTGMMREALGAANLRGLDVGCGQGAYVQRMRELGYDASGIDWSAGQVAIASRKFEREGIVQVGSALAIPAPDDSFDFVYTINVLHHLPSVEDQQRAFHELFRVLRPGGTLFVHEINTRNILFRFYMGYVFPSINCIDEGTERWLLPNRLGAYTRVPVTAARYFTFFPDFLPEPIVQLLAPIERWLEGSALAGYSAHYMASWRKPE